MELLFQVIFQVFFFTSTHGIYWRQDTELAGWLNAEILMLSSHNTLMIFQYKISYGCFSTYQIRWGWWYLKTGGNCIYLNLNTFIAVSLIVGPIGVLSARLSYLIRTDVPLFLRWSVVAELLPRCKMGNDVNNFVYLVGKPSNCGTDRIQLYHSISFHVGAWTCLSILPGFISVTNPKNCQVSIITIALAQGRS